MKQISDYLVDLYNSVYHIRNSSNNDFYDILESPDMQKRALLNISEFGNIDIKRLMSKECINDVIPFLDACKESPIPDSINKLVIIFNIIGDKLGFSYDDFELIAGSIIIKNHCYNHEHLKTGTRFNSVFNDETPFFSISDFSNITKIKPNVINSFMTVFCNNIN